MLCYDRIDVSEGIDKARELKEHNICHYCHYWYFVIKGLCSKHMYAIDAIINKWCLWILAILLFLN